MFLYGLAGGNEVWVWVNGRYAGHRPYKIPQFRPHEVELDLTKLLKHGENNDIIIRGLCNFDVFGANDIYEPMLLYTKKSPETVSSQ